MANTVVLSTVILWCFVANGASAATIVEASNELSGGMEVRSASSSLIILYFTVFLLDFGLLPLELHAHTILFANGCHTSKNVKCVPCRYVR